jgi:signal transduction histidine kinase
MTRRLAPGSLDLAPLGLGLLTIVLGLLLRATSVDGLPWWDVWNAVITGWAYAAAGLVAWWRRPHNRTGALLLACGWAFLGLQMSVSTSSLVVAANAVVSTLTLALIVHVLLAFPSGRLSTRSQVILVAVAYALSMVLEAPVYLLGADSPLQVADVDGVASVVAKGQSVVGTGVLLCTAAILVRRLRRADAAQRRVVGPLCVVGAVTLVLLAALGIILTFRLSPPGLDSAREFAQPTLLLRLPLTFVYGLLRGGFARAGEMRELASRIAGAPFGRDDLRSAVAEALGDRSVRLAYWADRDRRYVDADGRVVHLPPSDGPRHAVEIASHGQPVGAIIYDGLLISDPELVSAVADLTGVALDRERLAMQLRAAATELRASRQRLAVASDAERRRIARDLHDGAQQRLVLLAIDAQRMARVADDADRVRHDATRLREEVEAVLDDLRGLVHHLEPALLTERGLPDATAWLVARMPIHTDLAVEGVDDRLPSIVESTGYFLVSEALTNVVKHSGASRCAVEITGHDGRLHIAVSDDGVGGADPTAPGLRGLSDRFGAVGGTLTLTSLDGIGTRLDADMPLDAHTGESLEADPSLQWAPQREPGLR